METGFAEATRAYARWLSHYLRLEAEGLAEKREKMGEGLFPFLRGSFYRWSWQFQAVDRAVRDAPALLGAGDVHLENFGTWRDAEGRLVWGLNDFDEAEEMPFTADLVRLSTSLLLYHRDAEEVAHLPAEEGIAAILAGYAKGLAGGRPFILEHAEHETIRRVALSGDRPARAWAKIRGQRGDGRPGTPEDPALRDLLLTAMPLGARPEASLLTERKGLGSLGRARWRLVAEWHGGFVAREAKATAPSAWVMPARPASRVTDHRRLAAEARRAPDPAFLVTERWVIRRLSPEVRKIELADMAAESDPAAAEQVLLAAMGAELANLHAGTAHDPGAIEAWLAARPAGWLAAAARAAEARVIEDFEAFRHDPAVVAELPPDAA